MSPNNEIEGLAELIALDYWRSGQVNLAAIASAHGLTFNFGNYEDVFDGLLEYKAQRFHIYINLDSNGSADSPRARFSFAHELGHYFIDWHRCMLERGVPSHGSQSEFESNSSIEREADLFAANLLMPAKIISRQLRQQVGSEEIRRLSQVFGTSLSATAIRCAHVNVAPLIVMKWSRTGRAWCWSSDVFAQLTGDKSYRALERIPPDSVTRQFINGRNTDGASVHFRGTTLATWFPTIRAGSHTDEILVEECIELGAHGVLTILRKP